MMLENPTYLQIASDYDLWEEYIDRDGHTKPHHFARMKIQTKINILIECLGPEQIEDDEE